MRKRNNTVNVRLNDTELEKLNENVLKSGLSREAFVGYIAIPEEDIEIIRANTRKGVEISYISEALPTTA